MAKTTNIRQRKNGLWEGRYRLNGKQCAVYGQTKVEAKAKLAARMTEIEQGICIERTGMGLGMAQNLQGRQNSSFDNG